MCQASDENKRVEAQAASNSMTQINQQDVDDMVTVQYLLGSSNSRSVATLFHLTWLAAFIMSYLAGCLQHVLSVWLPLTCLTWLAAFIMSYMTVCLHHVLPGCPSGLPKRPSPLAWLSDSFNLCSCVVLSFSYMSHKSVLNMFHFLIL